MKHSISVYVIASLSTLVSHLVQAGSATWNLNPVDNHWNNPANWTPATVPNGPSDTATLDSSNQNNILLTTDTLLDTLLFNSGAPAYTLTITPNFAFTIDGGGISNSSAFLETFENAVDRHLGFASLVFANNATAGTGTHFNNNAAIAVNGPGASITFHNTATAGSGYFDNLGPEVAGFGGLIEFYDNSTAGVSTIVNHRLTNSTAYSAGNTNFHDHSTAGNATIINEPVAAILNFYDTSSADHATIISAGADSSLGASAVRFHNSSTAANAQFTVNGASGGTYGCQLNFYDTSTPDNATFVINGATNSGGQGGTTEVGFDAGTATFIANGGTTTAALGGVAYFLGGSLGTATIIAHAGTNGGGPGEIVIGSGTVGGPAQIQLDGGTLDISTEGPSTVTVGSVEGSGLITLGSKTLTVGSNSRNARFTGVIDDDFGGGSLTKVGTGKLVLTGQNTYGKSTTVSGGQLIVNNRHGSGTGRSTVSVNAGKLGGTGFISGAVIVGTGNGAGAILSPGPSKAQTGTLTIHRDLTVHSDGTYEFSVNNDTTSADEVVIDGSVTIDSGAKFDASASGTGVLPPGMVFTAVNKTSANPISGRFANLPDGSIVTVGGTNFQANYEGGDGNDLTLTVVP